jgi:hypothetical protein
MIRFGSSTNHTNSNIRRNATGINFLQANRIFAQRSLNQLRLMNNTNMTNKNITNVDRITARFTNVTLLMTARRFNSTRNANQMIDTCTLVAGLCTINNNKVTPNSVIICTAQNLGTVTLGQGIAVSARTAGTSYSLTSGSLTDTSKVGCIVYG